MLSFPLLILIGIYKYAISPFTPASCRHYPTCSSYAEEAIKKYGMVDGTYMAAHRLSKCHPWGTEGYDPVPLFKFKTYKKAKTSKFNLHQAMLKKDRKSI
ncbi:MAG: membrane protein insertion efficiency factor YidD [Bacteroidales bacterium]|nr:membrane protein insertion efficiency factor YidD [Bacteroidales bacterium]